MEETKVHPSELLEFATVDSRTSGHVEHGPIFQTKGTKNGQSTHIRPNLSQDMPSHGSEFLSPGNGANLAAQSEHRMTLLQGLRLYPKAIGWSALVSLAIVMEGYDTALINSFFAFTEFQQRYGEPDGNGHYQISTKWQSALTNGAVVGSIFGLFTNGYLTDRFGFRHTMMGALIGLAGFIFLSFFAQNLNMLLAGQVLCGLAWGIFSTLTTTYAAEVMPLTLRASLTSNVNLCWLLGQITALGVLRGLIKYDSEWSYRIPFGLQWVWIFIIFTGVIFAPESPWWLIRHDKHAEAKRSLLRLTSRGRDFNADNALALMIHTNTVELCMNAGTSYLDCFRGTNRRRTEIACMVWMTQILVGLPVIGYAAYFYRQAGFSEDQAFDLTLGMHGLAICGSLLSWVLMRWFGRRTLYIWGGGLGTVVLIIAGSVSMRSEWALASMVVIFIFIFDCTGGPVCYCLVAEIPSTRLRVKTVVLARVAYNVVNLITNVLMVKMLNPTAWNWKGRACFFWAATSAICMFYCYWRLPEPQGLTYMELDILFEKKAEARKFKHFQETLASTGYFSFYGDGEREVSRWQ